MSQTKRLYKTMKEGEWFTLSDLADECDIPLWSIGAAVRNLRKEKHGKHIIERRYDRPRGLYWYRMVTEDKSGSIVR